MTDYSESRNKPSTVESNRGRGERHIVPALGHLKVPDVTRADIAHLMKRMAKTPTNANRVLAVVRKMFNMAEVWGMRPDGSNPCRHIPKYPERGKTRLIADAELRKLYAYLDRAETEGLEHPFILLAIRLQFAFAARMSEILSLEWAWVDHRRVVWPDSKTGGMSKPMSAEALHLFESAPRLEDSPFVCPSIFDPKRPMPKYTYYHGWRRILWRAGLPHIGTHGIRHRAATDIANSGIPVKVGMTLTAHKTVTMFMRYVHTEDDPVRAAAEAVTQRRLSLVGGAPSCEGMSRTRQPGIEEPSVAAVVDTDAPKPGPTSRVRGFDDARCQSRTPLGNYRPFRHRTGDNRAVPPGTTHADEEGQGTGD